MSQKNDSAQFLEDLKNCVANEQCLRNIKAKVENHMKKNPVGKSGNEAEAEKLEIEISQPARIMPIFSHAKEWLIKALLSFF